MDESSKTPTPESSTSPVIQDKKGDNSSMKIVVGVVIGIILVICCCAISCFALSSLGVLGSFGVANQVANELEEATNNFTVKLVKSSEEVNEYDENVVVLELEIKNTSSSKTTFSTLLYLTLVDGNGRTYSQDYFSPYSGELDEDINPGETITGKISYVIEGNPSSLSLEVSRGLFTDQKDIIKVK